MPPDDGTDADPGLTAEVSGLFAEIVRRAAREYETAAARHGLTPQQAKALLAADEALPMRRMAERLRAEPSNLTGIVDRLESRGLVERRADPADRRVRLITATESGHAVAQDLRGGLRFAADPLAALDEGQRRTLRDLLRLVVAGA